VGFFVPTAQADTNGKESDMTLNKQRLGYLEGGLSIVLNTLLFALKLWAGRQAGSVAMVADAWHTLSDTLTSLVVVLGFWIASRPADHGHPFGHGRAELVGGVAIGMMLAMVGVGFLRDSFGQLRNHGPVIFGPTALWIFGLSALLKEGIAQLSIRFGRRVGAASLVADGWHHRSDAIASALILGGAFLGRLFWWMDGVLGLCVSLLILFVAYDIIRDAANTILGESPAEDTLRAVAALATECSGLQDAHHLHVHRYGDHGELTVHVRPAAGTGLKQACAAVSELRRRIGQVLDLEATIHLETEPSA
jgi:cation diffusion facilitator family transporter